MVAIAYVNGRICSQADASISVFDHGFLFGEGVYDVVRTYCRELFLLDRHFRRLRASAGMIALELPMSNDALERAVRDTMQAFAEGPGRDVPDADLYVRILVTRGLGDMTYNPAASPAPTLVIIVKPLVAPPASAYEAGVKVALVSTIRNHPGSVSPLIKSNNLLNNALAMQEALKKGAYEAIMRNYRGELAECSQSNLFIVKNGRVFTPRLDAGLLAGITREFVVEVAAGASVSMEDAVLHDEDLFGADEVFLTSTTREVVPIVRVDDRVIANGRPGPITRRLLAAYRQAARQQARVAV
ncbi:MAG: aminotransferase class IV [Acidobacteriota bacterium]